MSFLKKKLWPFIKKYWGILNRPSTYFSLGFLTLGGFIAGIIFWGGFNTAMEATNTEAFCTSCHEMETNVYAELQTTIHFTNRSGVRAICSDCHVPHSWPLKMGRKMAASKEVYGKIFGTINTREKFEAKRLHLAMNEWKRMEANDSLECRNCHSTEAMDITRQSKRAAEAHENFLFTGEMTCITCHKGIAHQLPAGMENLPTSTTGSLFNHEVKTSADIREYLSEMEESPTK